MVVADVIVRSFMAVMDALVTSFMAAIDVFVSLQVFWKLNIN